MNIEHLELSGVIAITPRVFEDSRGSFCETWNEKILNAQGIDYEFKQDNESISLKRFTLRGLHYQAPPDAQAKLVRCSQGCILDVAVDFRKGSATFANYIAIELSASNKKQLLVPEGFLHGFVTLTPDTVVNYKCSRPYSQQSEGSVHYADPQIGIAWPFEGEPILSEKDRVAPFLTDIESPFIST